MIARTYTLLGPDRQPDQNATTGAFGATGRAACTAGSTARPRSEPSRAAGPLASERSSPQRSEVLCGPRSYSRGRTRMLRFALLAALFLGLRGARGRRVSGAAPDDRRRLSGRRHGRHRGPPDGRFDEEDVHEGRRRPQPAGRRRFRRDGGSRAGEARRLHRHPRAELDPGDPSAAQRAAVQDAGRLRAHPEHDHLLHAPHREGGRAVEDRAGVHGRGQGESRQAPRRLARRGHDQPPDARAVADPRRLQDDARAVLGLG